MADGISAEIRAASAYLHARRRVIDAGYGWEVDWQEDVGSQPLSETAFLREVAWVILGSGMRERVIRGLFPRVAVAFFQWESSKKIMGSEEECRRKALQVFGHPRKIDAIIRCAGMVNENGIDWVGEDLRTKGPAALQQLPFIGPVTCRHLAKNIGFPTAKGDRHLERIAATLDYPDAYSLCDDIARVTDHPVAVVDVVLWRYATLRKGYVSELRSAGGELREE